MKKETSFYSEGEITKGVLYIPDHCEENRKYPAIILCHGFAGVKELLLPAFAERFANNGFISLCFDYRGFGESEGRHGRLIKQDQIVDIRNAITFMQTLENVDDSKVGLWGSSYGGANAIEVTANDDRVQCICAQVTFGNGKRVVFHDKSKEEEQKIFETIIKVWKRQVSANKDLSLGLKRFLTDEQSIKFYNEYIDEYPQMDIKLSFLTMKETIEHIPENYIGKIDVPVLLVGAENDLVNPVKETKILFDKANEPKSMKIIESAGHYDVYTGKIFEEVIEIQVDWFKKYLS